MAAASTRTAIGRRGGGEGRGGDVCGTAFLGRSEKERREGIIIKARMIPYKVEVGRKESEKNGMKGRQGLWGNQNESNGTREDNERE